MVGMWEVPLSDGIYQIEFEHGTTTGKRVVYINGKVSCSGYYMMFWFADDEKQCSKFIVSSHYCTSSKTCWDCFVLKEVLRRDWMFKLVGKETFPVGHTGVKATINIEALTGFTYEYMLEINGKSLQTFIDNWAKISKTWLLKLDGADCRIVLGKREKQCSRRKCVQEECI